MMRVTLEPWDVPVDTPFNHEYVTYDASGRRVKVICRKCGETIADVIQSVADVNPDTGYVTTATRFQLLINYTLVKMLLTNNLTVDSAMCKRCANRLTPEEVKKVYDSEILAIERDAVIHNNVAATVPIIAQLNANSVVRRIG